MRKGKLVEKTCAWCHKSYFISEKAHKKLKYCSDECRVAASKSRGYDVVCPICGTTFHTCKAQHSKYCSVACYAEAQKTEEHQSIYRASLKKKYGVTRCIDIPGVREKKEATAFKNFGVKNAMQSDVVKAKARNTNLKRYGVEYVSQSEEIRNKVTKTCLTRYGSASILGNKEFRQKLKKKLKKEFGVEHMIQLRMPEFARSILLNKEKFKEFIDSHTTKSAAVMYKELGVDDTTFYSYIDKYGFREFVTHSDSSYEHELRALFPTIHFTKDRKILDGREIDMYSEEHRIGIEFNGNYWHSANLVGRDYHKEKSLDAAKKGVFLFHIFEYEWVDSRTKACIISRLNNLFGLNTHKVFARKCTITKIDSRRAQGFYNDNHVQGKCPADVHIALLYEGNIVAVMSFKQNGINKNYQWELCRFANRCSYSIVGGASKLFSYFCKQYAPKSIISYSDIAKTSGNIYKILGFSCIRHSHPQYVWTHGGTYKTRYQCQRNNLIKLGWMTAESENTEVDVMTAHNYYQVYDCGKAVWVYTTSQTPEQIPVK